MTTLHAIAVFFLCVIIPFKTSAQNYVSGTVVDARTSAALTGVNISVEDGKGTSTNKAGSFRLRCTPPMRITVSHVGYQPYHQTIERCGRRLKIQMQPLTYHLQKITVEDRAEINRAASVSTLNLAERQDQTGLRLKNALNTIPGVQMQTRSPFGGQRITIRGYYPNVGNDANFNGRGYQLFIEHIPVTDAAGTTIMDDIDFATLGEVNIIRGPSPLYGNQIAGVVNLYTERLQSVGTALSQQLTSGSYGLFRSTTRVSSRTADVDLSLTYGRQSYDSFRPNDASEKDYITASGHYTINNNHQISAYLSYNSSQEQLAGGLTADDFYARRAIANANYVNNDGGVIIESFRSGITSTRQFNTHIGNETTVFASGHTLDQNFAHGFNNYEALNIGARTQFTYRHVFTGFINSLNGTAGGFIQKSNQSVDGVFIPPSIAPPFTPDTEPQIPTNNRNEALNYNLFTRWQVGLPRHITFSAGLLLNKNQFGIRNMLSNGALYSGSETVRRSFAPTLSPSVSVLKTVHNNVSAYASISTGTTPPLLDDILAADGSVNQSLRSEKAIQYELGSKGNSAGGRLSYRLALFDMEIDDRLATQFREGVAYTTNVGKQQNRGIELALRGDAIRAPQQLISLLQLSASYTYSDFSYKNFQVFALNRAGADSLAASYSGNKVAGVPPQMLNLGLHMQSTPGWYLNANYRFMARTPVTFNNNQHIRSYNLLNTRLGLQRKVLRHLQLDAHLGINNITGSTYYNFLFVGANVADLGDGYISPAPYDPALYGGLNLRYNF